MPNKATSQAQFRLFKGIAEGSIKPKGALTAAKAGEMLGGQTPAGLPERRPAAGGRPKRRRQWRFK